MVVEQSRGKYTALFMLEVVRRGKIGGGQSTEYPEGKSEQLGTP
jgi:hypothetical protein